MALYTGKVRVVHQLATFAALGRTSFLIHEKAKQSPEPGGADVMASILFSAFTFEAALNHVGAKLVPYWDELERLPWRSKLNVIASCLNIEPDFGRRPYQTLLGLFRFRDATAHGRDESGEFIFEVKDADISKSMPRPDAEALRRSSSHRVSFCTIENAEASFQDSRRIVEDFFRAAGVSRPPFGYLGVMQVHLLDGSPNPPDPTGPIWPKR
jgi:hypothetical protein